MLPKKILCTHLAGLNFMDRTIILCLHWVQLGFMANRLVPCPHVALQFLDGITHHNLANEVDLFLGLHTSVVTGQRHEPTVLGTRSSCPIIGIIIIIITTIVVVVVIIVVVLFMSLSYHRRR